MPLLTTSDDRDANATWEVVGNGRRFAGYLIDLFLLNSLISGLLTLARVRGWLPRRPAQPV